MVCRIHNLGKHRLGLDLRGGGVLYLEPNQISPPLREELLYDNVHLRQWLEQGLVRRLNSSLAELQEHEKGVAQQAKAVAEAALAADAKAADAPMPAGAPKKKMPPKSVLEEAGGEDEKPPEKKPRGRPDKDKE